VERTVVLTRGEVKYGYAGTFDCVAIANNEKILLDWKTSRKQKKEQYVSDYYLQVAAYCTAVEEMEQEKLDRATIVVFYNFKQPDIFKLSREDLDF
jgi:ATP-dependent exoDNAse (exonuclease V) beta subunit